MPIAYCEMEQSVAVVAVKPEIGPGFGGTFGRSVREIAWRDLAVQRGAPVEQALDGADVALLMRQKHLLVEREGRGSGGSHDCQKEGGWTSVTVQKEMDDRF